MLSSFIGGLQWGKKIAPGAFYSINIHPLCFIVFLSLQVQMVKTADLRHHLPRDCLPQHLGGLLVLDDPGNRNQQLLSVQNGRTVDPVDELAVARGIPASLSDDGTSIHHAGAPADGALRPQELLALLGRLQRSGIHQEYDEMRREPPPGTFHAAL